MVIMSSFVLTLKILVPLAFCIWNAMVEFCAFLKRAVPVTSRLYCGLTVLIPILPLAAIVSRVFMVSGVLPLTCCRGVLPGTAAFNATPTSVQLMEPVRVYDIEVEVPVAALYPLQDDAVYG